MGDTGPKIQRALYRTIRELRRVEAILFESKSISCNLTQNKETSDAEYASCLWTVDFGNHQFPGVYYFCIQFYKA
jgi:hypothetical protein